MDGEPINLGLGKAFFEAQEQNGAANNDDFQSFGDMDLSDLNDLCQYLDIKIDNNNHTHDHSSDDLPMEVGASNIQQNQQQQQEQVQAPYLYNQQPVMVAANQTTIPAASQSSPPCTTTVYQPHQTLSAQHVILPNSNPDASPPAAVALQQVQPWTPYQQQHMSPAIIAEGSPVAIGTLQQIHSPFQQKTAEAAYYAQASSAGSPQQSIPLHKQEQMILASQISSAPHVQQTLSLHQQQQMILASQVSSAPCSSPQYHQMAATNYAVMSPVSGTPIQETAQTRQQQQQMAEALSYPSPSPCMPIQQTKSAPSMVTRNYEDMSPPEMPLDILINQPQYASPQQATSSNPNAYATPIHNGQQATSSNEYGPPINNSQDDISNGHKMQLRVFYKHLRIKASAVKVDNESRHEINNPAGFIIYNNKIRPGVPNSVMPFQLPLQRNGVFSDKDFDMIIDICKDMEGGLHVEYDTGIIYATRYSKTGVYFWANDRSNKSTETPKLERKRRTPVFDFKAYFSRLDQLNGNLDAIGKEKLPVVVFTFGFPWVPGSGSLLKTYVHVEVTPVEAVRKLMNLSGGRVKNRSIQKESVKKCDIYKSNDPESIP